MYRWEYVKGQRAPQAVAERDADQRRRAADRPVLQRRLARPRPGRLDPLRLGLRRQRHGRLDRPEPDATSTPTNGVYTAKLTVTDSTGKTDIKTTVITVGNTSPTVDDHHAARRRLLRVGRHDPVHRRRHRPRGRRRSTAPASSVTFVLVHDTHGHAEENKTGCSGVLHTLRRGRVARRLHRRRHQRDLHRQRRQRPARADHDGPERRPAPAPAGRVRAGPRGHRRGRRASPIPAAARSAPASIRATGSRSTTATCRRTRAR